jgi:pimeloyl-ACP methyl ester carboxylesterase
MRWKKAAAALSAAAGAGYVVGSYLAGSALADALISPVGLAPGSDRREEFRKALGRESAGVEEFTHPGNAGDPAVLRCTFASPGSAGERATLLFLHGKGGNATEWILDAVRALRAGFNVLCPDLRGHAGSGGRFVTYGLLEKVDLEIGVRTAVERFGLDPRRIGVHSCSAGSSVGLQFCAGNDAVRALWLESPFSDPRAMARHYLHRKTGVPRWALTLASHWAVSRAAARLRRELGGASGEGWVMPDPLAAARSIRCPVELVYGACDELVPPEFVRALELALPRSTAVWEVGNAGHCHHADEAEAVAREEYERRWTEFFGRHLK